VRTVDKCVVIYATLYYVVVYRGTFGYTIGDKMGSSSDFYATWSAALFADTTQVGKSLLMVQTGYREGWSALGVSLYWYIPYNATWLVRLEAGTHNLKIQFSGYSDNTMNKGHMRYQSVQVMRVY